MFVWIVCASNLFILFEDLYSLTMDSGYTWKTVTELLELRHSTSFSLRTAKMVLTLRQAQDWKVPQVHHGACWYNFVALDFAIYGYVLVRWSWDVDVKISNIVLQMDKIKNKNLIKNKKKTNQQKQMIFIDFLKTWRPPEHPLCALICLRGVDPTVDPIIDRCTSKPCHPWGHMAFRAPLHAEYIWNYMNVSSETE